jgi:hypothetical protein
MLLSPLKDTPFLEQGIELLGNLAEGWDIAPVEAYHPHHATHLIRCSGLRQGLDGSHLGFVGNFPGVDTT